MQNILETQKRLLDDLQARWPGAEIAWDEARGVAARVRFEGDDGRQGPTLDEVLGKYGPLFGPEGLRDALREMRPTKDDLGMERLRFWQAVPVEDQKPVELYGSRLLVHLRDGLTVEVQSGLWRDAKVEQAPAVKEEEVRAILHRRLGQARGIKTLVESLPKEDRELFPLATPPRLVNFAWKGNFRLSWMAIAWGQFETADDHGAETVRAGLDIGPAFVDAVTGEVFFHSPGERHAENPTTGTGTRCTPLTGGFGSRNLNIVRVDATNTYRLKDTTRSRTVVTYDAAGLATYSSDTTLGSAIVNGTMPVSEDTDGDAAWTKVPANTTTAERTASQQSETDLHWFMGDVYDWFDAIGGRVGWDNNAFASPPVPAQTLHAVAHVPGGINAGMRSTWSGGNVTYWLKFYDGDATTYDYLAGSAFIVAHEYQHSVIEFSFEDAAGNPGVTYDAGWMGAMHEGLSDVFGSLYEANWLQAADISPASQIFRNIVFPRDDGPPPTTAAYSANNLDHWADRNVNTDRYARGTILAHCAYLMGSGGVHQRAGRAPVLIPVYSLGSETVNGRSVLKAARIWYRALNTYFGTVAAPTADPASDQNLFVNLRTACTSAASDLYPGDTAERKNTALAFHAVGMQPAGTTYGADCTFLRWGAAWHRSLPYVGVTSPMWASVDLFVNNGGTSDWNAQVNNATSDFENQVYCRVRNVGDAAATGVSVAFFYAKIGSAPTGWLPMQDRNGVAQTLTIGTLAAGTATFADSLQNTPPASAMVKWFLPPIPAGETVDHYCIRAVVTAANDVNSHNNDVQSNIAYTLYTALAGIAPFHFTVGNPTRKPIPVDVVVGGTLPGDWSVKIEGLGEIKRIGPEEQVTVVVKVDVPAGRALPLTEPFDGRVEGQVQGSWVGALRGHLAGASGDPGRLTGRLSGEVEDFGQATGAFEGRLDPQTGRLRGRWHATDGRSKGCGGLCLLVDAVLRPTRVIDIAQRIGGEIFGGVTLWVQVPFPGDDVGLLKKQASTRVRRRAK